MPPFDQVVVPEPGNLPSVAPRRPRGRPKATGRYATREELCEMVWRFYRSPKLTIADVARVVRVSERVVHTILETREGMPAESE